MSLYNFFSKMGTISYNNEIVTNILTSVKFKDIVLKNNVSFYPYVVKEGERPDSIAYHYYEDERYAWLVLLSNSITDPYFEWPLSLNEFNAHLKKKYGSIEASIENIAFYRINWYRDDSILTTAAYEALTSGRKKYWSPIVGFNGAITSYERKKDDTIVDTNKIIEITINSITNLSPGERVKQKTSGVLSASGTIRSIKDTSIVVNNISGEFNITAGSIGSLLNDSESVSKTVTAVTTLSTPIPIDEAIYWEAVSSYDYENELNESRKTIRLIDRQYLQDIEDEMVELLS